MMMMELPDRGKGEDQQRRKRGIANRWCTVAIPKGSSRKKKEYNENAQQKEGVHNGS